MARKGERMSDAELKLTPSQARALQIVREHAGIKPREFASFMWPESDEMDIAGGDYLGKLVKRKLVTLGYTGYFLTPKGIAALKAQEQSTPTAEASEKGGEDDN